MKPKQKKLMKEGCKEMAKKYHDDWDGNWDRELKPSYIKRLNKIMKGVDEGRTYLWACSTKGRGSRKCDKSKERLTICSSCCTEQAKRWYQLGRSDIKREMKK